MSKKKIQTSDNKTQKAYSLKTSSDCEKCLKCEAGKRYIKLLKIKGTGKGVICKL